MLSPDPNHLDVFATNPNTVVNSTDHRSTITDTYVARPATATPWLELTAAVLAVQGFIPEVGAEHGKLQVKRDSWDGWFSTGIPLLFDVCPGHDAHLVFPDSSAYGNNPAWRNRQRDSWSPKFCGIVFNTWNGFTAGYAVMPTLEYANANWQWIQQLFTIARN